MRRRQSGQATIEFALIYGAVILPLTFMTIFVAEQLWIWHSVVEFTRDGASYAATHCATDGSNVTGYMLSRVPPMVDQNRFQGEEAVINVAYTYPEGVAPETCGSCLPDSVSVSVTGYRFLRFAGFLGLSPATMPPFTTTVPMESGGYQDALGSCVP